MYRILATYFLLMLAAPALGQDKGGLELLILANRHDEKQAIEDATRLIANPANQAELEKCQKDGVPPPAPRDEAGKLKKYQLTLFRDAKSVVGYRWVELGPKALRDFNLDNEAETDDKRNDLWKLAKANRGKAVTLPRFRDIPDMRLLEGALFYSRDCQDRNLPEKERDKKKVDYFVLARRPEIDPKDPKQEMETAGVTSSHITKVTRGKNKDSGPHLSIELNAEGAKALAVLTAKNNKQGSGPENTQVRRHLAMVIDGQVLSAPTLNSSISGGQFMIAGVPEKELDLLAEKLRPKK